MHPSRTLSFAPRTLRPLATAGIPIAAADASAAFVKSRRLDALVIVVFSCAAAMVRCHPP
jgi:hypothetical protein